MSVLAGETAMPETKRLELAVRQCLHGGGEGTVSALAATTDATAQEEVGGADAHLPDGVAVGFSTFLAGLFVQALDRLFDCLSG
jgi:hypothetical protein